MGATLPRPLAAPHNGFRSPWGKSAVTLKASYIGANKHGPSHPVYCLFIWGPSSSLPFGGTVSLRTTLALALVLARRNRLSYLRMIAGPTINKEWAIITRDLRRGFSARDMNLPFLFRACADAGRCKGSTGTARSHWDASLLRRCTLRNGLLGRRRLDLRTKMHPDLAVPIYQPA